MPRLTLRGVAFALALGLSSGGAMAQSVQDSVIAQLREQGFTEFTVTRTWLGRVQIIALSDSLRREIVLNPTTGEILRDYWRDLDTGDRRAPLIADPLDDDDDGNRPDRPDPDDQGDADDNDDGGDDNDGDDGGDDDRDDDGDDEGDGQDD